MENLLYGMFFGMICLVIILQIVIATRKPKTVYKSPVDDVYINKTKIIKHKTVDKYPRKKPITKMSMARDKGEIFYDN